MIKNHIPTKDAVAFSTTANLLRRFFLDQGFLEVHTQDRMSILAACEDPKTVATYNYQGQIWPLPQTGQMWLEYELLSRPYLNGVFTVSTSYRNEPNPVPGRHEVIFPMFEFESRGSIEDLRRLETDLCEAIGLGSRSEFAYKNYNELAGYYHTDDLSNKEEMAMKDDFGPVVFLENFPENTSPFWNMKRNGGNTANKIDVIIHGMETIGSAERSCDREEMHHRFHTISDGEYAELLYKIFGKPRVEEELKDFLSLDFFPRYGGGIGMTRMMRGLKESCIV